MPLSNGLDISKNIARTSRDFVVVKGLVYIILQDNFTGSFVVESPGRKPD